MKTIILHGVLADKFGKKFRLAVNTAREASHALACQIPEFKKFMLSSEQKGLRFAVFLDVPMKREANISEKQLDDNTNADTIHIVPRIIGSGGDVLGWMQVIAGIALIGLSFTPIGAGWALSAGIGLLIGGATSLLMPTPEVGSQDPDGNRANYGFGGAVTTVAQGNPVPVLYGERDIGGFICSAGIYSEDKI